MVSENFGDFLDHYPGLMALVGAGNPGCGASFPHHHPQFNITESALHRGAALHVQYGLQFLSKTGDWTSALTWTRIAKRPACKGWAYLPNATERRHLEARPGVEPG